MEKKLFWKINKEKLGLSFAAFTLILLVGTIIFISIQNIPPPSSPSPEPLYTYTSAIGLCQNYCSALTGLPTIADVMVSPFCTTRININGTIYACPGLIHLCEFTLANGSTYCITGIEPTSPCIISSPSSCVRNTS